MMTSRGRRRHLVVFTALAAMLLAPASASGQEFPPSGPLPNGLVYVNGAIPAEVIEPFIDCPRAADIPEGFFYYYCVKIRAYDGELQLGSVRATIDEPLEILAGIGANVGTGEQVIVMADGGGDAGFEPVKISGGILGIPELDPLIDAEPLGLLSLSASPTIGELSAEAADLQPTHLPLITLPLDIQLNNTLLGDNCRIGTAEDPIVINLVTGTTEPPPGVAPMVGTPPVESPEFQWSNYDVGGGAAFRTGVGARSVDNTFAVPAVDCPGIGGLGDSTESLLSMVGLGTAALGPQWFANPFELLINSQAGLPSPAGRNHVAISVDTAWISPAVLNIYDAGLTPRYTTTPGPLHFGAVEVGSSVTEVVTVENSGSEPLELEAGTATERSGGADDQFEVVGTTCAGQTLAPGDQCELEVRFTPTSTGLSGAYVYQQEVGGLWFPDFGFFAGVTAHAFGVGVEPGTQPPPAIPDDPPPPAPPAGPSCLLGLGIDLGILCL